MKKGFKSYIICWAILAALFNAVCFILGALSGYSAAFWATYVLVMLAFVGQLVSASVAFRAGNAEKLFLNVSLIRISYTGLILTMIVGSAGMIAPEPLNWVGAVACLFIVGFSAISVVKAQAAAELVGGVSERTKRDTAFMKLLTANADSLCSRAKSGEAKTACKKVYEALRYSDPVSSGALEQLEREIAKKFKEFDAAVTDDDTYAAALANELLDMIEKRNNQCKALK